MSTSTPRPRALLGFGVALGLALVLIQCSTTDSGAASNADARKASSDETLAAWETIYNVLQHPRCMNCHPAGDAPLQGNQSRAHAQNVTRGEDGNGMFAMRCNTCHQESNVAGPNMPPGAPHWKLPDPKMPLVFEGRSSGELCRQLLDPAHNGGRTPEQLFEHLAHDPLVMWGWNPGDGRDPVSTPHAELVRATRTWIDGGCGCPE
jgi:hypothetical protein